ncbi:MAG TPA: hypothetical protein VK929_15365 [Longimicrobiales bacterium]|nr:hypothetical protein [Longimicrobiales bacterium]
MAGVWIGQVVAGPEAAGAVRFAGILAFLVQLAGFAVLVLVRARSELFLLGWGAGLMFRLATVVLVALWLSRDPVYPIRPALLSLVLFLFVLLLLEPLFLRRGLQTR